ncbi:MAG: TolC family protein [Ignavibacteria bacterium]
MKHIICLILLILVYRNIIGQDNLPQSISLSDAERIARENKPELKKGINKISSARGKYLIGISPQMPELSLTYDFVPLGTGLGNYEERSIELNQNIEFPLKTIYKSNQLNNSIDIVRAENEVTNLNVINDVRRAYIILLEKQALINIAEENSIVANEFKTKSTIRYNVGEATNLEKLTADVQYTQALNNLEVIKNQYKNALSDLLYSIGIKEISNDYNPLLTDSLIYIPFSETIEMVLLKTKNTNPLLLLSGLKKSNSLIGKKIAISSYLPDFSLGYKRQSINGVNNYYGVNFGISVPLWFMFDQKGKIEEANAEIKISENEFDENYISVVNATKKAFVNLKNSEKQILLYKNALIPESEEIYRVANASYQIGEITYLEYLQANQTLIKTKENYFSVLKDYNLNIIELEKAIGKKLF